MNKLSFIFFIFIGIMIQKLNANDKNKIAQPNLLPIDLGKSHDKLVLGPYFEILEDKEKKWTFDDILSPKLSHKFIPNSELVPNYGFTSSAYWLRLKYTHSSDEAKEWFMEISYPLIDYIDLYVPNKNGGFTIKKTGDKFVFSHREIDYHNFLFEIISSPKTVKKQKNNKVSNIKSTFFKPKNNSREIYMRFETESSMQMPITLWSPKKFMEKINSEVYGLGLYYGIMLVMSLYNLFIFFAIRDKSYLYYVLYITGIALVMMCLNGLAFEYLWPNFVWWANKSILFILGNAIFWAILFTQTYLNSKTSTPILHKVLKALSASAIFLMIISFFLPYLLCIKIALFIIFSSAFTGITVGIVSLKRGYRPARYYTLAWAAFLLGVVAYASKTLDLMPSVFLTEYSVQIGSALEVILLSLGLADRINELKRQTLIAQQQAVHNLTKADKLKDEFLANTSHELRTPLNGIIGLAESLIDGATGDLPLKTKQNLAMITSSGKRLSSLVNDILDFSRLKNKDLILNLKPVDLYALTDVVLTLSKPLAAGKDLNLNNSISKDLHLVYADENRLEQILLNLVGNAIKFTDQGKIEVKAELLNHNFSDQRIKVTVLDTGIGIEKEKQESIFHSFEQAEGSISREYGGTGLGLAVSKQLVELHNGEISVKSKPGIGSSFSFTLPVYEKNGTKISETGNLTTQKNEFVNKIEVTETSDNLYNQAGEPNKKESLNILVVDDEPVNLQVLNNHLSLLNYQVTQATNGEKALELIKHQNENGAKPFDLVILDVMMPKMSGYEVCKSIRKSIPAHQLPVIMLTAKNQIQELIIGFESGANDYMTKPFSKSELLLRIKIHTQLLEANRELKVAYDELLETHNELDQFAYHSAHDLKGPIARLLGLCKVAKIEAKEPAINQYLQLLESTADEMDHLLSQLEWAYELRSKEVIKNELDLHDLIHVIWKNVSEAFDTSDINFKLSCPKNTILKTDVFLISVVIGHLLDNAARFRDKKKLEKFVKVDIQSFGASHLLLKFKDNGVGIPTEVGDKIFEMFVVGNEMQGGEGMGLYEVKIILTKLKGGIKYITHYDGATEFIISLPL